MLVLILVVVVNGGGGGGGVASAAGRGTGSVSFEGGTMGVVKVLVMLLFACSHRSFL